MSEVARAAAPASSADASAPAAGATYGERPLTSPRGPFSARALQVVRAMAAAVFGREGTVPEDRLDWVEREVSDFVGAASFVPRLLLQAALLAVQWLPLLVLGRPRRFLTLGTRDRQRYLERMEASRLPFFALPVMALKIVIGSVYFEHPDARPETGYDGGCLHGTMTDGPAAGPEAGPAARIAARID